MRFITLTGTHTHSYQELVGESTLVLKDKDGNILRTITWEEWVSLSKDYPQEVADDQLSIGSVILMKRIES